MLLQDSLVTRSWSTCTACSPGGSCQVAKDCAPLPGCARLCSMYRSTMAPVAGVTASTCSSGDRLSDASPLLEKRALPASAAVSTGNSLQRSIGMGMVASTLASVGCETCTQAAASAEGVPLLGTQHCTAKYIFWRFVREGAYSSSLPSGRAAASSAFVRAAHTPAVEPSLSDQHRSAKHAKHVIGNIRSRLVLTSRIGHDDDAMPPGHSQNLPSALVSVGRQFRFRSKADSAVRLEEDAILLSNICLQHLWLHLHSHGVVGRCAHVVFNVDHPCMLQCKCPTVIATASGKVAITKTRTCCTAAGHPPAKLL